MGLESNLMVPIPEILLREAGYCEDAFFDRYSLRGEEGLLSLGREVDDLLDRTKDFPGTLGKAAMTHLRSPREDFLVGRGLSLGARDKDLVTRLEIAWWRNYDSVKVVSDMRRLLGREDWPRSVRYCMSSYVSVHLAGIWVSSWFLNSLFVGEHFFGHRASAHLLSEVDLSRIPVPLVYYPEGEIEPLDSEVYAFLEMIRESLSRE